ncbi:unnamed protein product [Rhizoctonia solani]|uniref:Uncharacterized protein n=1 Tax=Rhizoctonia solani TaxID=456999 RepID=A0A8H3AR91_9AGAM|nr:unnamed protein product [Rhizoctonia solani]
MSAEPTFDQYGSVSDDLADASKQLIKFLCYFLPSGSQEFDGKAFTKAINNRPEGDLCVEDHKSDRIEGQQALLQTMVEKLAMTLGQIAAPIIGQHVLYNLLMTNLDSIEEHEKMGSAWYEKSNDSSSISYRLVIYGPNPNKPSDFYALVCNYKITADITDKETWYSLTNTSEHKFGAEFDCIKLVCNEKFTAGP